ncbi:hypothetical protein [Cerasicoccus frondis]|uniref:hypothetical protein n=1 Tax=Cerasicoccus frondis TaxID=490090 RepID=UPI0028527804|nr:hypothetical protein [Cerasicoccus frondis]
MNFYIFDYNSNLYMMMNGTQITKAGDTNWSKSSEALTWESLETSFNPTSGSISFLSSSVDTIGLGTDGERYYNKDGTVENSPEYEGGREFIAGFGTGDVIYFDSGSTYSSGFDFYEFKTNADGAYWPEAYTTSDYSESDTMTFFAKATGYTLDDIDFSSYSDFYTELTLTTGDIEWTFAGYEIGSTVYADFETTQYYHVYLASLSEVAILYDLIESFDSFTDEQVEEIEKLITTTTSGGGDDLIELPGIPEPSTYALCFAAFTLGAALLYRRRNQS